MFKYYLIEMVVLAADLKDLNRFAIHSQVFVKTDHTERSVFYYFKYIKCLGV